MSAPLRDQPLSFHWSTIHKDFFDILGLPVPLSASFGRARTSILTELLVQAETNPHQAISYSRRKQFYATGTRYYGTDYTYNNVVRTVDEMDQYGLIVHFKMPPGNLGWQSSFFHLRSLSNYLG